MPEQTEMEEQESDRQEEGQGESISYFARWTDRYKEAREYLYGTMEAEPDEEAAHEIMLEEYCKGVEFIFLLISSFEADINSL